MDTWLMECSLVGESFANADGSSRQEEICRCRVGENVALRWDRENAHDPAAVAVHSIRGPQIGFLSRRDNTEFLGYHADGLTVGATISAIYGGHDGKPLKGVVIDIELAEDELEQDGEQGNPEEPWLGQAGFWLLTHP